MILYTGYVTVILTNEALHPQTNSWMLICQNPCRVISLLFCTITYLKRRMKNQFTNEIESNQLTYQTFCVDDWYHNVQACAQGMWYYRKVFVCCVCMWCALWLYTTILQWWMWLSWFNTDGLKWDAIIFYYQCVSTWVCVIFSCARNVRMQACCV